MPNPRTFFSLLDYFITPRLHSLTPPPASPKEPTPPATSHKPGTTTTSTHSPNTPKLSRSRCSPGPDTCAAAPPRVASPATSRWHAGSSSSAPPPPDAVRCPDVCPPHPKAARRHPQH